MHIFSSNISSYIMVSSINYVHGIIHNSCKTMREKICIYDIQSCEYSIIFSKN